MIHKLMRDELEEIKELKGWILLYGRRKVGKTFLIKNFLEYSTYFIVRRDGKIVAENLPITEINSLDEFVNIVKNLLKENKTVVVDEFQRLPEKIYDDLASVHPNGKLILSGSSYSIVNSVTKKNSPLLGLILPFKIGLIKPKNILRELNKHEILHILAIEAGCFLRDPWIIPHIDLKNFNASLFQVITHSGFIIPALIGEVFTEEERELTKTYEGILELLGKGEWHYKVIADILSNRGIIPRAESALVLPYIKNLCSMGLVEALPLYNSKKRMYKLSSALFDLYYYLEDRYNIKERSVSFEEAKPTFEKMKNLAIQDFFGDLFAQLYNGRKEYFVTSDTEIDFMITSRNKLILICEVKWGEYSESDIEKFKLKASNYTAKKLLIVKSKKEHKNKDDEIEILDAKEIIEMVTKSEKN